MNSEKISQLLTKQQLDLESKATNQGISKNMSNKMWMFFHRRNIFMVTAFVISFIITTILLYEKVGEVVLNKDVLDPTLLMIGLGIFITILVAVVGIFATFLASD